MTVNLQRNELAIELGGQKYTLRASFEAIDAIESDVGSIMALGEKCAKGTITTKELTAMIFHGARAHIGFDKLPPLKREAIGPLLLERGLCNVLFDIMAFPALAMNGVSLGKLQSSQEGQAS